ncbi:MAG: Peptidase [Bacteroidetes bacterium]|nr:Peptidase [Bacteroidota bacterium]
MQKRLPLLFFFTFFSARAFAQTNYPTDYFRSPIDTSIELAGNFGEIRPNHFHAGFDIKTNGKEGMRVYAAADGYISRIKISPYGYGNALYITHPNGYTSVYGHLQRFDGAIAAFLKKAQYVLQSFEVDTLLSADVLPVTKGQLIALSGNTGGSEGPHLHFEIRETATEKPINPYYFGYKIPDTVKPKITEIAIYPINHNGRVNGKDAVKKIKPAFLKGHYYILNKADTIVVNGDIGFGIETYDTENGNQGQNGVFSIELQSGGKRVYYHELEKFSFENARYVNAHIDYAEKQKHGDKIQKCFVSKNNQLGIYKNVINNGVLHFEDDSVHWIRYIVRDFAGNSSEMMLKVKGSTRSVDATRYITKGDSALEFDCTKENKISQADLRIVIPENALYDDVYFRYFADGSVKGTYSPLYEIMNDEVAVQKAYLLSIKAIHLPENLQNKACIISINDKGKRSYEGGSYNDGFVSTQAKSFGHFTIGIDTIAPKLKAAFKIIPGKTTDLSKAKTIGIIATDNLSGIRKYRGSIDGKWVLCEYEFKQNLLYYTFDEQTAPGTHTFSIDVTDDKANTATYTFTFKR